MRSPRRVMVIILLLAVGSALVVDHAPTPVAAYGSGNINQFAVFASLDQVSSSTSSTTITSTVTITSTSTSLTGTTLTTSTSTTVTVPSLALNPNAGSVGLTVQVSGSGYSTRDSSCSISGSVVASPSCSISGGALTGTFNVANVTFASYTVTATGNQVGDSAAATFIVNAQPSSVTLSPSAASPGTTVQISGSGFLSTDTSCSISGSPTSQTTCSIASGTLTGAFVVSNIQPGFYAVVATANPGGDSASTNFQVTPTAINITLSPTAARLGATVQVSGSGFSSSDSGCTLSGGAAVASETCSLSNGAVTASFIVANATAGTYTITVTGNPAGDSASATFTLTFSPIAMKVNPIGAVPGATVQVSGSGFSLSDSTCSISGLPVSSASCSISGGTLSGSFVVADVGVGYYTVTATGSTGDSASATFSLGPSTAPAIPGFPVEAILVGLLLGVGAIALTRRRKATA